MNRKEQRMQIAMHMMSAMFRYPDCRYWSYKNLAEDAIKAADALIEALEGKR